MWAESLLPSLRFRPLQVFDRRKPGRAYPSSFSRSISRLSISSTAEAAFLTFAEYRSTWGLLLRPLRNTATTISDSLVPRMALSVLPRQLKSPAITDFARQRTPGTNFAAAAWTEGSTRAVVCARSTTGKPTMIVRRAGFFWPRRIDPASRIVPRSSSNMSFFI